MEAESRRGVWGEWHIPPSLFAWLWVLTKETWYKPVTTPNRVTTHPGEILAEEFIRPLGLSINALAFSLRVPTTRIAAIVESERTVTADTALRLGRFFGTSPEFWINLQAMHALTKVRRESCVTIARDVQPRAE